jgi:hypothetical protein
MRRVKTEKDHLSRILVLKDEIRIKDGFIRSLQDEILDRDNIITILEKKVFDMCKPKTVKIKKEDFREIDD